MVRKDIFVYLLILFMRSTAFLFSTAKPQKIDKYSFSKAFMRGSLFKYDPMMVKAIDFDLYSANGSILVTGETAIYHVDIDSEKISLIAGGEVRGYQEGYRDKAKFGGNIGLFQVSQSQYVVADKVNSVLRFIDDGQTSLYSGTPVLYYNTTATATLRGCRSDWCGFNTANSTLSENTFWSLYAISRYTNDSFVIYDDIGIRLISHSKRTVVKIFDRHDVPFAPAMFLEPPTLSDIQDGPSPRSLTVYLSTNCSISKVFKNEYGDTTVEEFITFNSQELCPFGECIAFGPEDKYSYSGLYFSALLQMDNETFLTSTYHEQGFYLTKFNETESSTEIIKPPKTLFNLGLYVYALALSPNKEKLFIGTIDEVIMYNINVKLKETNFAQGLLPSTPISVLFAVLVSILQMASF